MEVARTDRAWRWLGGSMMAGAAYDLAFAVAMVFFGEPAARLLRVAPAPDPNFLGLAGVLLAILAGMYVVAGIDPARFQRIVAVAIAGRSVGFAFLGWVAWGRGGPQVFAAAALADLGFAVLHGALLVRARGRRRAEVPADQRS